MSVISRICPVCQKHSWSAFLQTRSGFIITGDQRVRHGELRKVECNCCGVVANATSFSLDETETLYGSEYELNTLGHEEHLFFTDAGPRARSEVICEWIRPFIPSRTSEILEVGCGQGNLLERLQQQFSDCRIFGIDGSHKAVELATAKGLNVSRGLLLDDCELSPADVIIAVNVLEHVENIDGFLRRIRRGLRNNGRLILCLPVQNYYGYDIFFLEHVWHFTVEHVLSLLRIKGWDVIHFEYQHPVNHGIGLFVCEASRSSDFAMPCQGGSAWTRGNRDRWLRIFLKVNAWLDSESPEHLAVFGGGEVFALFLAFTELRNYNIVACIDEDPNKIGSRRQGVPIHDVKWLGKQKVDAILLTINPKYHDSVKKKLSPYVKNIFSWSPYDD